MTQLNDTNETPLAEVVVAKRRIKIPHVNAKKAVVTTLAVVGALTLAKAVKDRLHAGEDTTTIDGELVETSDV